ncbi:TIGR03085 family metal-binding protein [Actinomadura rubrisoli]|uniref:TIGR03085 family protein n=1 Tax=Actinomadura rubrisoli TaxID=2530368 RepID=A0A4R5BCN6_9ACTN|nr:TIGR03085 family metal-binding protein [Actinomadura rubrisoli]TDD83023.1 TIGR03085 family protein [Actinomadura rubrisoli]
MSTPEDGAAHETPAPSASPGPASPDPVRRERELLAAALAEAGPDAATKCAGWNARDLAAHLVVREGRPDAAPGILLRPLAFYTERVRRRTARAVPFDGLVERFRQGPPKFSPYALPGVDKIANGVEFFVHHEDILRARPDWSPRELSGELEGLLWRRIKIARFVLRKVQVEVTLVQPDGRSLRVSGGRRASGGGPRGAVRVHGPVGELVLWALGRGDVAKVRLTGATDSVKTLTETGWSL